MLIIVMEQDVFRGYFPLPSDGVGGASTIIGNCAFGPFFSVVQGQQHLVFCPAGVPVCTSFLRHNDFTCKDLYLGRRNLRLPIRNDKPGSQLF